MKRHSLKDMESQEPSRLLIDHMALFPKGKALDLATGYGRNAFYLAEQGYQVEGFDRDKEAVAFCNAEAKRRGLSFVATHANLEQECPFSSGYALVTCFYYLDRRLIPKMKEATQIGGFLVYETFLIDQHERFGKPSRSEFCWRHNELLRLFLDFRILYYFEGLKEDRWIAQIIAQRS